MDSIPNIVQMLHNWPHLYGGALAEVSDLADWKEREQGKFSSQSEAAARDGSRWLALPHCITPALVNYRKFGFAEVGASALPKTLDEYRKFGAALKKKDRPFGQTLGHTVNDRGGQVDDGVLEGGLRRGRARLGRHDQQPRLPSGEIAATLNGGSIHIPARRRLDIKNDKGQPL